MDGKDAQDGDGGEVAHGDGGGVSYGTVACLGARASTPAFFGEKRVAWDGLGARYELAKLEHVIKVN